ncbi:endonuclease domain-containing protein [Sphingopyxis witflariensis]|uniref:endonuclease domain-containing protein n=1 Tax=Sphingopyxis witflariensis TaxID=173675 RepID=UPI001F28FAFB|nr:DUF559 domain-containing protein [Sphingopyxis witflariensis]
MARKLRRNDTEAEKRLWSALRSRQFLGLKFRRQSPVGEFIADFLCEGMRIIVQADGGQHADNPADTDRTVRLQAAGYHVIRYWNNASWTIWRACWRICADVWLLSLTAEPLTQPSPKGRGLYDPPRTLPR